MYSLGINIGSSNVKAALLEGPRVVWSAVEPHEGNFPDTLTKLLSGCDLPPGVQTLTTGTEGRHLLNIHSVIEPLCIEAALQNRKDSIDALVSLGGEDLVVYTIDSQNKIITSFSGNKCASGTGEFFKQQLARMNMTLDDIHRIPEDCRVLKLSSRCSVFMKSDCTHRLNKGEARTGDIVLSLSNVMAVKVADFLKRARIEKGKVLLTGGVTQNPYILRFIRERMPQIEFIVPEQAPWFEAYGAALMAASAGSPLPAPEKLFKKSSVLFKRFKSLKSAEGRVTYLSSQKGKVVAGREYILGVDGGSTTTKASLIDFETSEVTASFYGRTHGDPVRALKSCLKEIQRQIREDIGDGQIH
ncbi:MAG: activase, partial [Smithella sp.]|nr:activase [Smithella sp.]